MTAFIACYWCGGEWNADNPEGLADHESHCALAVKCPLCDAGVGDVCTYPSGQVVQRPGTHGVRERFVRQYPVSREVS